jgi:hypothetical protein
MMPSLSPSLPDAPSSGPEVLVLEEQEELLLLLGPTTPDRTRVVKEQYRGGPKVPVVEDEDVRWKWGSWPGRELALGIVLLTVVVFELCLEPFDVCVLMLFLGRFRFFGKAWLLSCFLGAISLSLCEVEKSRVVLITVR